MKKLPLILLLICSKLSFAQPSSVIRQYIETYKEIAMEEMHRTGVPAAITLAQGIHETGAGQSHLVQKSNNHFGIKCKSEWKGASVTHDDDARGECFRKYDDPMDSYRDHSDFLKNRAHYSFLFKLDPTDYEAWAYGLKKAGYATNPKYPQILIKLIRDFELQSYTLLALERKPGQNNIMLTGNTLSSESSSNAHQAVNAVAIGSAYPTGVFRINDTRVVMVAKGTSFLKVAEDNDVSLSRMFEYNDMQPQDIAAADQLIYLQRKRKKGEREFHVVAPGETLHSIAQAEGIRLSSLLQYNQLREGLMPRSGEKLYLQDDAPDMPRLLSDLPEATVKPSEANPVAASSRTYAGQPLIHTVQPKETMYAIARKYGVALEELKKWNDLSSTDLKIGQQLRINKKTGNAN